MNAKRKATEAAQTKDTAKISIFLCVAMSGNEKNQTNEVSTFVAWYHQNFGKGGQK